MGFQSWESCFFDKTKIIKNSICSLKRITCSGVPFYCQITCTQYLNWYIEGDAFTVISVKYYLDDL